MTAANQNQQPDYKQLMAKALAKIEQLEGKLKDQVEEKTVATDVNEPIAIVGMACRFPGAAKNLDGFLQLLRGAEDGIGPIPEWRWDVDKFYDSDPDKKGKSYVKEGGFIDDIREFDPAFFDISPREAMGMDPQQRLWLEVCWEALENAAIIPADLYESQSGVFVGGSSFDFAAVMAKNLGREEIDAYLGTGASLNIMAGRLSYLLGLTGPSMAVDTACSSSLVAIHNACQSLRQKECHLALAGGVNILLSPETYVAFSRGRMLSASGRCRTFSDEADGFIRSEGCGAVVLKRLSDAVQDGDRIYAVLNGSAVNQDGPCGGLTVPSGPSQQKVIQRALQAAGVRSEQIQYIEAHGTGTPLGDPIEMGALAATYGQKCTETTYVGAIKSNLGHLEAAAGVAGLIKTALSLYYGEIYSNLHFQTPSQHIDWQSWPVQIPQQLIPWPSNTAQAEDDNCRYAAVSSFGLSGTNAHMIMSRFVSGDGSCNSSQKNFPQMQQQLLLLSGRNQAALRAYAEQYLNYLEKSSPELSNLCYSHNRYRSHFSQRKALIATSNEQLQKQLSELLERHDSLAPATRSGQPKGEEEVIPRIAFLFTGQGSQWAEMAQQWYGTFPEFTRWIEHCNDILSKQCDYQLKQVLGLELDSEIGFATPEAGSQDQGDSIHQTAIAQPALFAFEYALSKQWMAWGVQPQVMLGHSLGEYVAACLAGVFELEQALVLLVKRAQWMQNLPGEGIMVAFAQSAQLLQNLINDFPELSLAAYNGAESCVISGPKQIVQEFLDRPQVQSLDSTQLATSHGFHSLCVEPMMEEFHEYLQGIELQSAQIPIVSNLIGRAETECYADPGYWVQHLRQAVRFQQGVESLVESQVNIMLEIGPKASLCGLAKPSLPDTIKLLPSCKPDAALETLNQALIQLAEWGVELNWDNINGGERVELPTYPWNRQTYWPDWFNNDSPRFSVGSAPVANNSFYSWCGQRLYSSAIEDHLVVFEKYLSPVSDPWLLEHQVYSYPVVPMAYFISMATQGLQQLHPQQQMDLQQLWVHQALVLNTGVTCHLQLVIDQSAHSIKVLSRSTPDVESNAKEEVGSAGDAIWQEHFSANYQQNLTAQTETIRFEQEISDLKQMTQAEMSGEHYYALFAAQGIDYGPEFKTIEKLHLGPQQALVEISASQFQELMQQKSLHPIALDTLLQSLGTVLNADLSSRKDSHAKEPLKLPTGIQTLSVNPELFQASSYWLSIKSVPESNNIDIHLLSPTAEIIVAACGVETQELSKEQLLRLLNLQASHPRYSTSEQDWLYHLEWQEHENSWFEGVKSWLIIDPNQSTQMLVEQLKMRGHRVEVIVEQQPQYTASLGEWLNAEAWHEIVDARAAIDSSQEWPQLLQPCVDVLHSIQQLSEPLASLSHPPRYTVLLRNNTSGAAIQGLMSVLSQEYPQWRPRVISAVHDVNWLTPLLDDSREWILSYRDNHWQHLRLVNTAISTPTNAQSSSVNELDPQANYLITGGLGALGLVCARWLAQRGAKKLLLTTRRTAAYVPAELQALYDDYPQLEVQIHSLSLDDKAAVQQLLEKCQEQQEPVRGLVHCAGYSDDDLLIHQNAERFQRVATPKVAAAKILDDLTRHAEMQFFMLFSSFNALLGSLGQSAYAAANAAMDHIAIARQEAGYSALSINWGPWQMGIKGGDNAKQDGDAKADDFRSFWQQAGIEAIDSDAGMKILDRLLDNTTFSHEQAQIAVIRADWKRLQRHLGDEPAPSLIADLMATASRGESNTNSSATNYLCRLQNAASEQYAALLEEYFIQRLASTLRLNKEQINRQDNLSALGLDSLAAVELRATIRKELQCDIAVAKFLQGDVASIIDLMEMSLRNILASSADRQASPSPAPDHAISQKTSMHGAMAEGTPGHEMTQPNTADTAAEGQNNKQKHNDLEVNLDNELDNELDNQLDNEDDFVVGEL